MTVNTQSWYERTKTGLKILRAPEYKEWAKTGKQLSVDKTAIPFLIGDWVNVGQDTFAEKWTQATDLFGAYDYNTIANYASCCRKVPRSRREKKLSFSHHQAVAPLPADEQIAWLKVAVWDEELQRPLTAKELRDRIKGEDVEKDKYELGLKKTKTQVGGLVELAENETQKNLLTTAHESISDALTDYLFRKDADGTEQN